MPGVFSSGWACIKPRASQHSALTAFTHPDPEKVADGCHLNRDIETALLEAGFELDEVHYIDAEGIPKIGQRMLLARAHKPL